MKPVKKFIIVTPRAVSPAGVFPRFHPPLGAISVLSEAEKKGFSVALFDGTAEGLKKGILDPSYNPTEVEDLDGVSYWKTGLRIREILSGIADLQPDVIGLSCATIVDRGEVSFLATAIKIAFPDIPLILGGHEASHWYREILGETEYEIEKIPAIDYVIVGPGQPVISPLLDCLSRFPAIDLPPGVAYRSGGTVKYTGPPSFCPNQFAIPDYDLIPRIDVAGRVKPLDVYSYIGNPHAGRIGTILGANKPVSYLPLLTSYGCGFNCRFCDTDKNLLRYSVKNAEKIISDFDRLFGIDYIDLIDNNFGGGNAESRKIAFEILSLIAQGGYQIGFSNGLTFESMARDNFRLIRQFGQDGNVRHIAFPCENGNDRILKMIRKPHNLSLVRRVLKKAKEELPYTNREGFFIGGFPASGNIPAENPLELEETFRFITECLEGEFLHQAIFLTLSPVTREYRQIWRKLYPSAPFEHCLFSRKTGVWPYDNGILDKMHQRVEEINKKLGAAVTRKL